MKTKAVILQVACALYNDRGVSAVTLRDVATALGRAYGNVTYHFASKEPLIEALYAEMTQALSEVSAAFAQAPDPLTAILQAPQQTFAISLRYLFLLRDYLDIVRGYPALAERVRLGNEARKTGLRALFRHLRDDGLLRPELSDADLDYLMELSGAMRTFFFMRLQPADLQRPTLESEYVDYVNRLLFPYLSAQGQTIYHRVAANSC
jgi:AcrR family transcriptional regulator